MDTIPNDHPNLRIFKQHGFLFQGTSGSTQAIGRCPFCGANKKFFINPEKKTWDCKICGKVGGYQKFLGQLVEHCKKEFSGKVAEKLAERRGISIDTLNKYSVGYNRVNKTYLLPVWDVSKKELYNVRLYDIKSGILRNSAGCKTAMYGLPFLERSVNVIWLCEGEWDAMAMDEILNNAGLEANVLSVPGATTFKAEWAGFFTGKIVHVAFDNDYDKTDNRDIFRAGAGKVGARKVQENLKGLTKSLEFTNWPSKFADGFDVSDLYTLRNKNAKKTIRNLVAMSKKTPPPIINPDGSKDEATPEENNKQTFDGPGLMPEEVYARFKKWLILKSTDAIDVMYGSIIANRIVKDQIWMFLVGPSGCGKSELTMSLDDCPEIFPISSLTPNTLISGSNASGSDPSLIPKLDGMNLVVKDFTTIMEMQEQAQKAIMSQLRDAYDGTACKPFGTGAMRKYNSRFGFISGVTQAVEQFLEGGTALGERFLSYPIQVDTSWEGQMPLLSRVQQNTIHQGETSMRDELKQISKEVLNYDFGREITIPPDILRQVMAVGFWVSRMRGSVTRDKTFKKEITHRPYIEIPTRLVSQCTGLLMGLGLFHRLKEVTQKQMDLVRYIAVGSTPYHHEKIVRYLWRDTINQGEAEYGVDDICNVLNLPHDTSYRFAENLAQLGILRVRSGRYANPKWRLTAEAQNVMTVGNIYPEFTPKKKLKTKKKNFKLKHNI